MNNNKGRGFKGFNRPCQIRVSLEARTLFNKVGEYLETDALDMELIILFKNLLGLGENN